VDPRPSRTVYKYLDLADRFVRVRVASVRELRIDPAGLDRRSYRNAVIGGFIEGFESGVEQRLAELHPAAPDDAAELLYQMAVSVNPNLEIRGVTLQGSGCDAVEAPRETEPDEPRARLSPDVDAGALLRRLRRGATGLERRLASRVFGQAEAVAGVARAARRAAAGLRPARGPLGTMLFAGPTGTGKTELARALADELGGPDALLRIDCGELGQGHETARLIGAPPGYVGYEAGGFLTEGMQRAPRAVVLFDEVEKAHPKLHEMLLSILEEGELVDGKGRAVSFASSFVILTSNAGAREISAASERVGFRSSELEGDARDELSERALRDAFAPEFLGRVDDVVHFRPLDRDAARHIAAAKLGALAMRVRAAGARLYWTSAVADWVAEQGVSERSGARGLLGVMRGVIETELAERMLALVDPVTGAMPTPAPWLRLSIRGGRPTVALRDPERDSRAA